VNTTQHQIDLEEELLRRALIFEGNLIKIRDSAEKEVVNVLEEERGKKMKEK
jgi:hypothetical protein